MCRVGPSQIWSAKATYQIFLDRNVYKWIYSIHFWLNFKNLTVRSRENIFNFWASDNMIYSVFDYFMANLEEKWALSKEQIVFHKISSIKTFRSVTFARYLLAQLDCLQTKLAQGWSSILGCLVDDLHPKTAHYFIIPAKTHTWTFTCTLTYTYSNM